MTLFGERYSSLVTRAIGKLIAASAYIGAAWMMGALTTQYGRVLLLGMAFCWIGDLLLLSVSNRTLFLLGLASFLLGHVAYIGAFAARSVSALVVLFVGLIMAVFAGVVLNWLQPHLDVRMRLPVRLYVIAISIMMAMSAGTFAIDGNWLIPLGALLFFWSDLSVARDRFVAPGFVNRAWGLPLYFCAQMILAASVGYSHSS